MPKSRHVTRVGEVPHRIRAKIYQQDPLVASQLRHVGLETIRLPGEPYLGAGPTTTRVAVVDYNVDTDTVFQPAPVQDSGKGFAIGAGRLHDVHHHQVNVWAIITRTLNILEDDRVFGRRIPWAFPGGRLKVLPHAGYWDNAFYDRATGALHFFYFEGQEGETVYTCLSHDIITHELGHAVLDGLKPYYYEITSPDTAGFHEYFGDALAMTSALTLEDVVENVVRSSGQLGAANLVSSIASQFGAAVSGEYGAADRSYLRSAQNTMTLGQLRGVFEEHDHSLVPTGAYYDFLKSAYDFYRDQPEYLDTKSKDRKERAKDALVKAAQLTSRMFLRALDYCPPVGVTYRDYARAIWRADRVAYPTDPLGIRDRLFRVFRGRGLARSHREVVHRKRVYNRHFHDYDIDTLSASPTDAYVFVDQNREALDIPRDANLEVVHVYRTRKVAAERYRPPQEVVIEFVWPVDVLVRGKAYGELSGERMTLWCGGTLVFDRDGNVLYYILKRNTPARRKRLRDYLAYLIREGYMGVDDGEHGIGARAHGGSAVIGHRADGRLRLMQSAGLLHRGRMAVHHG